MADPLNPSGWSDPTGQQPTSPPSGGDTDNLPGYAAPAYGQPEYSQRGYYLQPGDGQQPGYGQPMYVAARTNGMAIAALVCSLAGLMTGITAPVGAILGHVARKQIRETGEQGNGMALAGIIVGWIVTGLWLAVCAVYGLLLVVAVRLVQGQTQ